MENSIDLTIIIPFFNEEESLPELVAWIHRVLDKEGWKYELIMVDDGSRDGSWEVVRKLSQTRPYTASVSEGTTGSRPHCTTDSKRPMAM